MKNKNINEVIKDRLNDYDSPVEANKEWRAFVKRRETKKRKRFSLLLLLTVLIFTSVGIGGYFYLQNKTAINLDDQVAVIVENTDSSLSNKTKESQVQNKPKNTLLNKSLQPNKSTQTPENAPQLDALKKPLKLKKPETSDLNQAMGLNQTITANTPALNKNNVSDFSKDNQNLNNKTGVADIENEIEITAKPFKDENKSFDKKPTIERTDVRAISNLETLTMLAVASQNPPLKDLLTKASINAPYSKRKIEIYSSVGIGQARQIFKSKNTAENLYENQRKNSETTLESYRFDLGVNVFIKNNVFINPNIVYHQWYDRVNHQFTLEKDFQIENALLKKITYLPSGEVEAVYGDTLVAGTRSTKATIFNQYRTIDLGINIGKYLFNKNRLELGAFGGLNWNIYAKTKGQIIDSADSASSLVDISKSYKRTFGLGLTGGLIVNYKLNQIVLIQIRPSANYYMRSVTEDSSVLNSKLFRYGINAGINIKLK